ncbi:hypothetical protein CYMTET_42578 [Cymbomonas tetramitiformis]|uniref:THUMP domain-containing protein n=1 Tax=Cymbomonas tetramitiformis TaxID=36881 RepID=A0AAE0C570_9CHLO|nr:hypothetical protein CYMTET_42578 [Cymbomonas tetramitiformis]
MDDEQLAALKSAAEKEMRRKAPDLEGREAKRAKASQGEATAPEFARFDYKGVEALLKGSQGFLITCSYRKEKSTTKEALELLTAYLPASTNDRRWLLRPIKLSGNGAIFLRLSAAAPASKEGGGTANSENICASECAESSGAAAEVVSATSNDEVVDPVKIMRQIFADLQSSKRANPKFVQRIIPVQTTCLFQGSALETATSKLLEAQLPLLIQKSDDTSADTKPVRFAVLCKTRGADEGANAAQGNKGAEAMGKGAVIKTMADCMMDACSPSTHGDPISALAHKAVGASVDLKTPQVVLVAEVVQVVCRHDASATQVAQTASGNCQVCALSVIGDDLITNVPKVNMKSFAKPQTKNTAGGG